MISHVTLSVLLMSTRRRTRTRCHCPFSYSGKGWARENWRRFVLISNNESRIRVTVSPFHTLSHPIEIAKEYAECRDVDLRSIILRKNWHYIRALGNFSFLGRMWTGYWIWTYISRPRTRWSRSMKRSSKSEWRERNWESIGRFATFSGLRFWFTRPNLSSNVDIFCIFPIVG